MYNTAASTSAVAGASVLAITGVNPSTYVIAAVVLIGLGVTMLVIGGRRKKRDAALSGVA